MEKCDRCGAAYELSAENCRLLLYRADPVCNHLEVTCPECEAEQITYLTIEVVDDFRRTRGLKPVVVMSAPPSLIIRARGAWASDGGCYIRTDDSRVLDKGMYDLTSRLQAEVERFASNLEAMPDEELLRGMQDPAQRSAMPQRWID